MTVVHTEVVFADEESVSNVVDVADRVVVAIHMPDEWDAATLTLLASWTGEEDTFHPVHDGDGELEFTVTADMVMVVSPDITRGLRFIQLRSGNTDTPVDQSPARTIRLATIEDSRA